MAKKYPKMALFGTSFARAWGFWPRSGANHTHTAQHRSAQLQMQLSPLMLCTKAETPPLQPKLSPQIFVVRHSKCRCASMSNYTATGAFIGELVPANGFSGLSLAGAGAPLRGNHTHKPYTDELQILCSWCMPRQLDFATAAEVDHPDQLRDRVGCALSDIHCSRCPRSWSAADSPNLCTNLKLRVHQLDNICSSHSKCRFHRCRIGDAAQGQISQRSQYTDEWPVFVTSLCMGVASGPAQGQICTTKDELQILCSHAKA